MVVELSQDQIALAVLDYIRKSNLAAAVPYPWDTNTKLKANDGVFSAAVTIVTTPKEGRK